MLIFLRMCFYQDITLTSQFAFVQNTLQQININLLLISVAFGIAAGANGNPNTKEWSQAERIQVTAQALYGYGYWGPFLLEFEEKTLTCGQEDMVRRMFCLQGGAVLSQNLCPKPLLD